MNNLQEIILTLKTIQKCLNINLFDRIIDILIQTENMNCILENSIKNLLEVANRCHSSNSQSFKEIQTKVPQNNEEGHFPLELN